MKRPVFFLMSCSLVFITNKILVEYTLNICDLLIIKPVVLIREPATSIMLTLENYLSYLIKILIQSEGEPRLFTHRALPPTLQTQGGGGHWVKYKNFLGSKEVTRCRPAK